MTKTAVMMHSAIAVYRKVVPHALRAHIWEMRAKGLSLYRRERVRAVRLSMGRPVVRVPLPHGRLYLDLRDDGVGRPLYEKRSYEPRETRFLANVLRTGMTFVDVGANIGYFTVLAARKVGASGRVVAVEPEPYNYSLLERNVRENGCENVTLCKEALGASRGRAILGCSVNNFGDHRLYDSHNEVRRRIEIPVSTLDDVLARHRIGHVDVVKMDVQGYECKVVEGMETILRSARTLTVLSEFWPLGMANAGGDAAAFLGTFAQWGFSASILNEDGSLQRTDIKRVFEHVPELDPAFPDRAFVNVVFQR
jgi:FkbM family methyltransferase